MMPLLRSYICYLLKNTMMLPVLFLLDARESTHCRQTYGQLFGSLAVNTLILFPSSHKCQPTTAGLHPRGRRAPRVGFTSWACVDHLAV